MKEEAKGTDHPQTWLDRAKSNLSLAMSTREGVFLEDLCFEAQQAAEKSAKAVLLDRGVDFPYTHDLAELLTLLQEETNVKVPEKVKQIPRLTRFAVAARYPGPLESVTKDEYEKALKIAQNVVEWAENTIYT